MNNNESQSSKDELEKNKAANEENLTDRIEQTEEDKQQHVEQDVEQNNSEQQDEEQSTAEKQENDTPDAEDNALASASKPEEAATAPKGGSNKVWMAISAVLAILLVIVLIKPPFGGGGNEVVASVNGKAITKDMLYEELVVQGGAVTLDNLITEELIVQAADKAGVTVTDEEVNKEIQLLIDSVGSEEQFTAMLNSYGIDRDSFTESKRYDVMIRKVLEPQTTVTEDDIKAYYDENIEYFKTPAQVRASHILVETKEEAEDIYEQLQNGADFATLVKEHSLDTATVEAGGDLDFFTADRMEENFSNAAFALKVGEISQPVESSAGYGFHIIKKTDEKAATTPTLEEKQEEIRLMLVTQQVSELAQGWLDQIRSEAKITNTLEEATTDTTTN